MEWRRRRRQGDAEEPSTGLGETNAQELGYRFHLGQFERAFPNLAGGESPPTVEEVPVQDQQRPYWLHGRN